MASRLPVEVETATFSASAALRLPVVAVLVELSAVVFVSSRESVPLFCSSVRDEDGPRGAGETDLGAGDTVTPVRFGLIKLLAKGLG
jgi:hypothetical protein